MATPTKAELETLLRVGIQRSDKDVEAWARALRIFLQTHSARILRQLQQRSGKISQLSISAALGQLEEAMNDAGLKEVFEEASGIYRDQVTRVLEETKLSTGETPQFSRVFQGQVEQFISLKNQGQTKTILNFVDDIRSIVAEQVLLGITPDFNALADDAADRTVANLKTDFNTEVAAFHRQVTFEALDMIGADFVLYAGNVQENSRPFCRARVGKVFRYSNVKTWDNGQGLPVIPYLGGYNCRHRLVAIRKELAEQIGISEL